MLAGVPGGFLRPCADGKGVTGAVVLELGEYPQSKRAQMARKIYGLDEHIKLAGRMTTIRKQFELGKAWPMRVGDAGHLGEKPLRHWVEIEKDAYSTEEFDISEVDFKLLRGEDA